MRATGIWSRQKQSMNTAKSYDQDSIFRCLFSNTNYTFDPKRLYFAVERHYKRAHIVSEIPPNTTTGCRQQPSRIQIRGHVVQGHRINPNRYEVKEHAKKPPLRRKSFKKTECGIRNIRKSDHFDDQDSEQQRNFKKTWYQVRKHCCSIDTTKRKKREGYEK